MNNNIEERILIKNINLSRSADISLQALLSYFIE